MTVCVCIDDNGGMTFNNRRQSRDREVIKDIESLVGDKVLYVSDFSEDLFVKSSASVICIPDPLAISSSEAVVFVENLPLSPYAEKIDKLVIYKWNRCYPFDTVLDVNPKNEGFTLIKATDFVGKSHEKITKEVYVK